jgi:hypothetical protein
MVLDDLIRGTVAVKGPTVAKVATVAVANRQNTKSIFESAEFATATPATFATDRGREGRTVAEVATVAVANPQEAIFAPSTANQWRLFFADGQIREVTFAPARVEADVRRDYPGCRALIEIASTVAACALCQHATKFGNCGEPVRAGLTDRFEIVRHPAGGAGCKTYLPQTLGDTPERN